MIRAYRFLAVFPLILFIAPGCMMYTSELPAVNRELIAGDVSILLRTALEKANNADSVIRVEETIRTYEGVLTADPANYEALTALSHLYLLAGDYRTAIAEKKSAFIKALRYSERAMYTNREFKRLIDQGEDVWEATRVLKEREMEPMLFWTTAVFYYYKNCLGAVGQVINFHWIRRARTVLEHMTAVDPDFKGGTLHFTWGIYYLAIPESVGGDREKSTAFFLKAIETGPDWLINRWGRAKYYHVKLQNRKGFEEDLRWVLSMDVNRAKDHYAWKMFFRQDAERMLKEAESFF